MRAINRGVVALAAITLLGLIFAASGDAQNNIGGQAVVPYRIDPTGRACTTTSPFILYLSQLYNCQSSAYAAYTTGGGGFSNPMTTLGDLILGGAAGAAGRLGIGANATVLASNGTTAAWSNNPALSAANMTSFPASLMTTSTVLVAAQEPAHSGDMTNSAGSLVTAVGAIGGKTVSLSGNFTTTGAFNPTLAFPSSSTWTFPAGPSTIMSTATVLGSAQVPTFTGDVTASGLALTVGAIGGKTVSLSGNFATTGAFNPTFAIPSSSTWTFPAGPSTLMSTATVLASGQMPTFTGDVTNSGLAMTVGKSTNLAGGLLGSLPYQSAVNTTALLAGNTTSAKQYLSQTGTGTVSAIPAWGAIAAADVPAALSSTTSVNGTTIPSSSTLTKTIASGTSNMGTTLIATTACATVVTTPATGTLSTDAFTWTNNLDVSGVTGYTPATAGSLRIYAYPTTDNVNFKVCNPTTASITPSAITLNWRVTR